MGKATMFLAFVWLVVCLAGSVVSGSIAVATTRLTADITDADTTITVSSTNGFLDTGIIIIGDERIAYSDTTATTFRGTAARPLVRGTSDTDAAAHVTGDRVRTVESMVFNQSMAYNLAVLSDASGLMYFVAAPLAIFSLLLSFVVLPLDFLGTDLQILTYIWGVVGIGMIVSLTIALAGGRRV